MKKSVSIVFSARSFTVNVNLKYSLHGRLARLLHFSNCCQVCCKSPLVKIHPTLNKMFFSFILTGEVRVKVFVNVKTLFYIYAVC